MAMKKAPLLRFFAKIVHAENGCWLWIGSRSPEGYARLSVNLKPAYAHRWCYEHFVGPIPFGFQIDHLCRIRHCVNPDHLQAVPPRINCLRGTGPSAEAARRSCCVHGHPWDEVNILLRPDGSRYCRACGRERERARKERIRSDNARGVNHGKGIQQASENTQLIAEECLEEYRLEHPDASGQMALPI